MPTVSGRRRRRNLATACEAVEDAADAVRIVVGELRSLLDPLGSRVLTRAFDRLEQLATDLDKLAKQLGEIAAENGNGNGRH